jgi:hypothetical protein
MVNIIIITLDSVIKIIFILDYNTYILSSRKQSTVHGPGRSKHMTNKITKNILYHKHNTAKTYVYTHDFRNH